MKIVRIQAEGYGSNCWVLIDEQSEEYAIIDPSATGESFLDFIEKRGMKKENLKYILLTHGHFDHIFGADEIRDITGAPLCIHKADADFLTDSDKNAYRYFFREELVMRPCERELSDGDVLTLGSIEIKVMSTPGHSEGSVCYFVGDVIFTGDTLFDRSIGRTDLIGSGPDCLINAPGYGNKPTQNNGRKLQKGKPQKPKAFKAKGRWEPKK